MSIRRPDGDRTAALVDDINRRAARVVAKNATDDTEADTFLEALGLRDYARAEQQRKSDGRLATKSRKKGTATDAAR